VERFLIAALTREHGGWPSRLLADKRRAQSGPVPCSGGRRRGMALDEVSAAIPGDAVAGNVLITGNCKLSGGLAGYA
jgi:hypothetical protein